MPDFSFCPQCNTKYRTAGMPAFKRLRCKQCQGVFVVPADAPDSSRDREGAIKPLADARASEEKDAEHAIPAAIGDSSALGRANFKGGVTLDDVAQVSNLRHETDDTIEGLPKPIERNIEAAIKPAATDEKYIVEGEIARGGMGVILKAADRDIRRPVAMKVMLDAKSAKDKARFVEEAQVTGQLEHPNIVPIHELGIDAEGRLFFTMKLVKGKSLKDVLDELRDAELPPARRKKCAAAAGPQASSLKPQAFTLGRLLNAFTSICNAIAFAHAKGVVHRDLKPANIMLGDYGEVLVMDWGLAKVVPHFAKIAGRSRADDGHNLAKCATGQQPMADGDADSRLRQIISSVREEAGGQLTMDGTIIGTPHYMPPEQADGKIEEIDARSDIYSLGAMLYEILTLKTPCEGKGVFALIKNVSEGNITPPDQREPRRNIPKELSAITMKALARRKEDRYQRVEDLRRDIELFIEGRAVSAKEDTFVESVVKLVKRNKGVSVATAGASIVVVCVVGVAFWLNLQEKREAQAQRDAAKEALAERDKEQARRQAEEVARRAEQKKSVPAFVEGARAALVQRKFDDALAQMNVALEHDPDNADAHLMKGQLLIFRKDFPAARTELAAYLKQRPKDADAKRLADLAARGRPGDDSLSGAFVDAFTRQKAFYFADSLTKDATKLLAAYKQRLDAAWPGRSWGERISRDQDGSLALNFRYLKEVRDLSPLKGMALNSVHLVQTSVTDLTPLVGMPLTSLTLNATPIKDLVVLRGAQLQHLDLWRTSISDLRPLVGMPLRSLNLDCCPVRDLTPLKGMPLERLSLEGGDDGRVLDITPLKGLPLKYLFIGHRKVGNLTALEGMLSLEELDAADMADWTPLRGLRLRKLVFSGPVSDLSPLKGMPLRVLYIEGTNVNDAAPLEGMELEILRFNPRVLKKGLDVLRKMKSLREIGTSYKNGFVPAEFWKKYDAGEFK